MFHSRDNGGEDKAKRRELFLFDRSFELDAAFGGSDPIVELRACSPDSWSAVAFHPLHEPRHGLLRAPKPRTAAGAVIGLA